MHFGEAALLKLIPILGQPLWGVGEWLPWDRTIYTSGISGLKFASGFGILKQDWCTIFSNSGNSGYTNLASAMYLIEMVINIVGAITVCHFASRITAGISLVALVIGFSGGIVSGLQTAANSHPALSTVYSGSALFAPVGCRP